jgi:putative GTP pyrophosphokinase
MNIETLVNQFNSERKLYLNEGLVAKALIKRLLKENSIPHHLVTSRVKNQASLRKKIKSKPSKYKKLTDVTDLLGLRIILYLEDQIKEVEKLLLHEDFFDVDYENALDKSEGYGAEFGYRSLHHILSIKQGNLLDGDSSATRIKFEVQIKTILSHSWAQVTHDIGYKPSSPLPEDATRKMFRIAALLELADKEFIGFKSLCESFAKDYASQNSKHERDVPISVQSLQIYLNTVNPYTKFENEVSRYGRHPFSESLKANYHDASVVKALSTLKIKTLYDLSRAVLDNKVLLDKAVQEHYCGTDDNQTGKNQPERGFLLGHIITVLYIKKSKSFS